MKYQNSKNIPYLIVFITTFPSGKSRELPTATYPYISISAVQELERGNQKYIDVLRVDCGLEHVLATSDLLSLTTQQCKALISVRGSWSHAVREIGLQRATCKTILRPGTPMVMLLESGGTQFCLK